MARPFLAALVCLALVGCMPFRWYPLPVSSGEARATFAPIATAASNLGYRFYQHDDRVIVEPDAATRIDYTFDASGNYAMCVMLKDKNASRDEAFAAGKAKGDDVWNRAMALRASTTPAAPTVVVAPPAPGVQINISH
ncbi:MAG: hypothetical protein ACXVAN_03685 [Polyangia bacterium]